MRFESRQLPAPQSLSLLEPYSQVRHGLRPQTVDSDARVELIPVLLDQPALTQGPQMSAHERKSELGGLSQFTRPAWPLAQQVHDAPAVGVRQRGESAIQIVGAHVSGLNFKPVACSISAKETSLRC